MTAFSCLFGSATLMPCQASAADVKSLGLAGDGKADDTDALQAALDSGAKDLYFSQGMYRLGTIRVPDNVSLRFAPDAAIWVVPDRLTRIPTIRVFSDSVSEIFARWDEVEDTDEQNKLPSREVLFEIKGNDVSLSGLHFDFAGGEANVNASLDEVVYARAVSRLTVADVRIVDNNDADRRNIAIVGKTLIKAIACSDVTLRDSTAEDISHMLLSFRCENIDVHGNRMRRGYAITTFSAGGKWLRHHDNWSQQVRFQVVWRGGSPDPSRKAPRVPLGSANQIHDRDLREGDDGWHAHTQGAFDVLIQNNYAEYGVVLCWGNKGRQVLIDGNIARFMWDYTYGAEGGENHIFSNNISINSAVAGIMSLYWGEKMLITGNLIMVRHEPYDAALAAAPFEKRGKAGEAHPESAYFGQFLRFHHGPPNPEDIYGTGSAIVTSNLFVNELANRPSGFSIENGRDMMVSGNKFINGMIRVHGELTRVKVTATDTDEFASSEAISPDQQYRMEQRITDSQSNSVTLMGNEFISRQPGDKPIVIVNGSVSNAIIRNNVFRKERSTITFTPEQIAREQSGSPRYMLYAIDDPEHRALTNDSPDVAITVQPSTPTFAVVEGNLIRGWRKAVVMDAEEVKNDTPTFLVHSNSTDGTIEVDEASMHGEAMPNGNIALPAIGEKSRF